MISRNFKFIKQGIAITLVLSLVWTSGGIAEAALDAPHLARPAVSPLLQLAPPAALGSIVDYYSAGAEDSARVILIQDLHAHYGVQKNIAGILDFLDNKLRTAALQNGGTPEGRLSGTAAIGSLVKKNHLSPPLGSAASPDSRPSGQPPLAFALAVEGAAGPIDLSVMALFPDVKIKQAAADYLMREGELTGGEYFAVMRGLPHALTGVEDLNYYTLHRDLFRKTLAERDHLVHSLKTIAGDLVPLRKKLYSRSTRHIQRQIDAFEKGDLGADEYIRYLASKAADYGSLEIGYPLLTQFLQNPQGGHEAKIDLVFHQAAELAFRLKLANAKKGPEKDLVQVEHDLALLLRVADLQATELEVRDFAPRLNQFVALAKSLTGESTTGSRPAEHPFDEPALRRLISSSIDYYVMALMRNQPMIDNTLALIDTTERRLPRAAGSPKRRQSGTAAKGIRLKQQHLSPPLGSADALESRPSGLPPVAVLVAGGFHTGPITQILRDKKISYVVISPTVDQITEADHALYVKRLSGNLLTEEEILAQADNPDSPLAQLVRNSDPKNRTWFARLENTLKISKENEIKKALAIGLIPLARTALTVLITAGALQAQVPIAAYFPTFGKEVKAQATEDPAVALWLHAHTGPTGEYQAGENAQNSPDTTQTPGVENVQDLSVAANQRVQALENDYRNLQAQRSLQTPGTEAYNELTPKMAFLLTDLGKVGNFYALETLLALLDEADVPGYEPSRLTDLTEDDWTNAFTAFRQNSPESYPDLLSKFFASLNKQPLGNLSKAKLFTIETLLRHPTLKDVAQKDPSLIQMGIAQFLRLINTASDGRPEGILITDERVRRSLVSLELLLDSVDGKMTGPQIDGLAEPLNPKANPNPKKRELFLRIFRELRSFMSNPERYQTVLALAQNDPDPAVQTAANALSNDAGNETVTLEKQDQELPAQRIRLLRKFITPMKVLFIAVAGAAAYYAAGYFGQSTDQSFALQQASLVGTIVLVPLQWIGRRLRARGIIGDGSEGEGSGLALDEKNSDLAPSHLEMTSNEFSRRVSHSRQDLDPTVVRLAPSTTTRKPVILLVDDDAAILRPVKIYLEKNGYTVVALTDPTDVYHYLLNDHVDLLITDIKMPKMHGDKLARDARQLIPDLPIIVMTGSNFGQSDLLIDGLSTDIEALGKPFELRYLLDAISKLLPRAPTSTVQNGAVQPTPIVLGLITTGLVFAVHQPLLAVLTGLITLVVMAAFSKPLPSDIISLAQKLRSFNINPSRIPKNLAPVEFVDSLAGALWDGLPPPIQAELAKSLEVLPRIPGENYDLRIRFVIRLSSFITKRPAKIKRLPHFTEMVGSNRIGLLKELYEKFLANRAEWDSIVKAEKTLPVEPRTAPTLEQTANKIANQQGLYGALLFLASGAGTIDTPETLDELLELGRAAGFSPQETRDLIVSAEQIGTTTDRAKIPLAIKQLLDDALAQASANKPESSKASASGGNIVKLFILAVLAVGLAGALLLLLMGHTPSMVLDQAAQLKKAGFEGLAGFFLIAEDWWTRKTLHVLQGSDGSGTPSAGPADSHEDSEIANRFASGPPQTGVGGRALLEGGLQADAQHLAYLKSVANMSQSAYDQFARDLIELNLDQMRFNPNIPEHIRVDEQEQRFVILNTSFLPIRRRTKAPDNTLWEMTSILTNYLYGDRRGPWAEAALLRQEIIAKVIQAARTTNLPLPRGNDGMNGAYLQAERRGEWLATRKELERKLDHPIDPKFQPLPPKFETPSITEPHATHSRADSENAVIGRPIIKLLSWGVLTVALGAALEWLHFNAHPAGNVAEAGFGPFGLFLLLPPWIRSLWEQREPTREPEATVSAHYTPLSLHHPVIIPLRNIPPEGILFSFGNDAAHMTVEWTANSSQYSLPERPLQIRDDQGRIFPISTSRGPTYVGYRPDVIPNVTLQSDSSLPVPQQQAVIWRTPEGLYLIDGNGIDQPSKLGTSVIVPVAPLQALPSTRENQRPLSTANRLSPKNLTNDAGRNLYLHMINTQAAANQPFQPVTIQPSETISNVELLMIVVRAIQAVLTMIKNIFRSSQTPQPPPPSQAGKSIIKLFFLGILAVGAGAALAWLNFNAHPVGNIAEAGFGPFGLLLLLPSWIRSVWEQLKPALGFESSFVESPPQADGIKNLLYQNGLMPEFDWSKLPQHELNKDLVGKFLENYSAGEKTLSLEALAASFKPLPEDAISLFKSFDFEPSLAQPPPALPEPPQSTKTNPPQDSMDVSADYLQNFPVHPNMDMLSDEQITQFLQEEIQRLDNGNPALRSRLQSELAAIQAYRESGDYEQFLVTLRILAAVMAQIRTQEPNRYVLHFARDLGYTYALQAALDGLDGKEKTQGGALYLNTPMMGDVYAELRSLILNESFAETETELGPTIDQWFEDRMASGDPGFQALAEATRQSLEGMGVFNQDQVLLFDTGFVGTMPWYVHAVIRYYDQQAGRAQRDIKVLLVHSNARTPQISPDQLPSQAQDLLDLQSNSTMLSLLENADGHPVRFDEEHHEIQPVWAGAKLRFRFMQLVLLNIAIAQHQEAAARETAEEKGYQLPHIPELIFEMSKSGNPWGLIKLPQLENYADILKVNQKVLTDLHLIKSEQWLYEKKIFDQDLKILFKPAEPVEFKQIVQTSPFKFPILFKPAQLAPKRATDYILLFFTVTLLNAVSLAPLVAGLTGSDLYMLGSLGLAGVGSGLLIGRAIYHIIQDSLRGPQKGTESSLPSAEKVEPNLSVDQIPEAPSGPHLFSIISLALANLLFADAGVLILLGAQNLWTFAKNKISRSSTGGALKKLGLRDAMDEDALVDLRGRHAEFESLAKNQDIYDGIQLITVKLPAGVMAYHLPQVPGKPLIVAVDESIPPSVLQEAIYHEQREAYWEIKPNPKTGQRYSQHEAHVLASAEQIRRFARRGELTPYHLSELKRMARTDLGALTALMNETDQDRAWHHELIRRAGLSVPLDYEHLLREQAQLLRDAADKPVPSGNVSSDGALKRIARGRTSVASGNDRWVVKIMKGKIAARTNADLASFRKLMPRYTVQVADLLRNYFGSIIPQAHLDPKREGILIQERVRGLKLSELSESVQSIALKNAGEIVSKANELLPDDLNKAIRLDGNVANFRFDSQGNVVAWFDYVLDLKTPVELEWAGFSSSMPLLALDDVTTLGELRRALKKQLPLELYNQLVDARDNFKPDIHVEVMEEGQTKDLKKDDRIGLGPKRVRLTQVSTESDEGAGMHDMMRPDIDRESAGRMAEIADERLEKDLFPVTIRERQVWAKELRAETVPGTPMARVLHQPKFSGLRNFWKQTLDIFEDRSKNPRLVAFGGKHVLILLKTTPNAPGFETRDRTSRVRAFASRRIEKGQTDAVLAYVQDRTGAVHETVENGPAANETPPLSPRNLAKRRHTQGFFLEGISDGKVYRVPFNGRDYLVAVPKRALREIDNMFFEDRARYIRDKRNKELQSAEKFPDDSDGWQTYDRLTILILNAHAVEVQAAKAKLTATSKTPPKSTGGSMAAVAVAGGIASDLNTHSLYQAALERLPFSHITTFLQSPHWHWPFMIALIAVAVIVMNGTQRVKNWEAHRRDTHWLEENLSAVTAAKTAAAGVDPRSGFDGGVLDGELQSRNPGAIPLARKNRSDLLEAIGRAA